MKKRKFIKSILLLALILLPLRVMAATLVSSIAIEGVGPLNLSRNSWNISITTSLNYANIIVTPANENVSLEGGGKVEIEPGENTIVITATDGTNTEKYTIVLNVTKTDGPVEGGGPVAPGCESTGETTNPDTGGFINYETLIVMVLAFVFTSILIRIKKVVHKLR